MVSLKLEIVLKVYMITHAMGKSIIRDLLWKHYLSGVLQALLQSMEEKWRIIMFENLLFFEGVEVVTSLEWLEWILCASIQHCWSTKHAT